VTVASGLRCAALSALALSCAAAEGADTSTEREAVIGGVPSGPEDDAVVEVRVVPPPPYYSEVCSGVLLAPNVVLTALHCVATFDSGDTFACRADGSLDPKWTGGWIGEPLEPAAIEVYFGSVASSRVVAHGLAVLGSGSTVACLDDVALVVLDTELPARGRPVRTDRPVVEGELMTVIGFGENDLHSLDVIRTRRSGVPVLAVGPDDIAHGLGAVAPRTFLVGDGPCLYDNGGPALSDETGAVTGVFSFNLGGDCEQQGARGWFSEVAPFAGLVRDAFELAGGEPVVERTSAGAPPPQRGSGCALAPGSGPSESDGALLGGLVLLLARRRRREPQWPR
jgi:hypothetical protein